MAGTAPRHSDPSPSWPMRTWAGHPGLAGVDNMISTKHMLGLWGCTEVGQSLPGGGAVKGMRVTVGVCPWEGAGAEEPGSTCCQEVPGGSPDGACPSLAARGRRGCGTPTQVLPVGCHHHNCKFAQQPPQDTLFTTLQQAPTQATPKCHLVPLGPIPRDSHPAILVGPLHLAPTHRGSTTMGTLLKGIIPMDTPHRGIIPTDTTIQDHRGAPLTAKRSTIRSTRSTPSTTDTSTPAAQAAAAVLTLTEEVLSHLQDGE
ncbi:uncharacterized protein LOC127386626 [Apus apus]|uniref:uncharacterized protein LOC127386626 n=1 Tax=Apus apus TaxID=8895 RepID=UPI0021F826A1|nr:uncharacterized protein LOC127386626 [Apus apus]